MCREGIRRQTIRKNSSKMKRIFSLSLFVVVAVTLCAAKYKIVKLSTPTIVIAGRTCKVGNMFSEKDLIKWSSDEQVLCARNMDDNTYKYFAAKAFKARKASTAYDYLLHTHKMSTRSGGFDMVVERDKQCAISENRIALVIGNANYVSERSLSTPIPDAIDVSKTLSALGFNVYVMFDAGIDAMNDAIKRFAVYAKQYQTALVYYAGHGSQFNGDAYLIPVDAAVETSYDVLHGQRWLPTKRIVSFLNEVPSLTTRILMLDACRTNSDLLASRGDGEDSMLDTDELNEGVIFYSTKNGYEAYDEAGAIAHSPFATAVMKHIGTPNLSVGDFITDVMKEVKTLTSVAPYPHPQEPRSVPTLTHRFYFNPSQAGLRPAAATTNVTPAPVRPSGYTTVNRPATSSTTSGTTSSASTSAADAELVAQGKKAMRAFNYDTAKNKFSLAASHGSAEGYYQLGLLYSNSNYDGYNRETATSYFVKAANQNHTEAMYQAGMMYLGIDNATAKQWLRKAANAGHQQAKAQLSRFTRRAEDIY